MRQDGLILFRSLTFAQRAAHFLEGCTYCVRLRANRIGAALALLEQRGMEHGRVFTAREDGGWQEVRA